MLSPMLLMQLTSNELFRDVDEAVLHRLAGEMELVSLDAGQQLFLQGDRGDSMYILLQGRLGVSIRNLNGTIAAIDEHGPGASVGEMALLTGQARTATVHASDDAVLVRLSRRGFERLAEQQPDLIYEFARLMLPRFQRALLAGILTDLFGDLDAAAVHTLQAELDWRHLTNGDVLCRQGDAAYGMFVVVSGRLRIIATGVDDHEQVIGEIGAGDTVGEFAILTDDVRSASVYAVRDTDVVYFPRALFERLVERYPRMLLQITRRIVERSKRAAGRVAPRSSVATTFMLLPADRDVSLAMFAERLERALARYGPTLRLDKPRFDHMYGRSGAAELAEEHPLEIALRAWLDEQERNFDYIIYEADAAWTPWSQRCLRQADRLLLVGNAASSGVPGTLEQEIARRATNGTPVRMELVLLHPNADRLPSDTRRWITPRSVATHYHIRPDSEADIARLARLLTSRAVGLALGGGGARGFAHIGVIRALHEAGIPIDIVGGTSIGACIGAQVAMGLDWATMVEMNREGFVNINPMADYTLPVVAMLTARKLGKVYTMLFGDTQIEDLWVKYFCMSSSLTRGAAVIHEAGPVRKYVRASMSVPGIVPPVPDGDDLLIDGGVLNNLPADIIRQLGGAGYVIAVDVNPAVDLVAAVNYGESLSGWYAAWRRLNPFGTRLRVPSIHAILERTTSLSSVQQAAGLAGGGADLYLHPQLEGFGMFEVKALERIVDAGYRAAQAQLAEWKQGKSW